MSDAPDPSASLAETAAAFRAWIDHHRDELEPFRTEYAEDLVPAIDRFRPLLRMLWEDGWNQLGWAPELGGRGGTPVHRFVVAEELAAAGYALPEVMGALEIIAPMLVRFAPHLAAAHVPAGMRGDELWCQGFSEPDAGSDLGSLRTRAVPDGDGFRLTGQKMWSSNAIASQWSCVLARTGESDSGYRGLTMFWVDLSAPGVRVVPTLLLNGRHDTAELFLDDVYVGREHLIGDVGAGWSAVMYLMQFERGAYAWYRQAEMYSHLEELVADHCDEFGADADRVLGDAFLATFAVRAQVRNTIAELAAGKDLGPEISVDKILLSTAEQTVTDAVRKLVFPRFELADEDDEFAQLWRSRWAYSRITTIYGGAGEVQRDLVGERLLGLPRGR